MGIVLRGNVFPILCRFCFIDLLSTFHLYTSSHLIKIQLVGNFARLGATTMNFFAIEYLVMRSIYTWLYLNTETKPASFLRTFVFNFSILHAVYIWLAAGHTIA